MRPNRNASERRCAVYLHYDADDVLLYVGITETPNTRGRRHVYQSVWLQFAARGEFVWCDSREEAHQLERQMIRELRPVFNRTHAGQPNGERIRAYLTVKNRLDLLAPPRRPVSAPVVSSAPAPPDSDSDKPVCGAAVFNSTCVAEPHDHRFHLLSNGTWVLTGSASGWTGNVVAGEVQ